MYMRRKSTRHTQATPELERQIVEESIKGTSVEKIRCMFNASRRLIIDIQKKNHVTRKDRCENNKYSRNVKIIELYESGERRADIARNVGSSYSTVVKVLNKHSGIRSYGKMSKSIDIKSEQKTMQEDSDGFLDNPISKYMFHDRIPEDIPKIRALRKAGWCIEKIADEMYSNPDIIRSILKEDTK